MTTIPGRLRRLDVPAEVLTETQELLREAGTEGLESTVLWLGRLVTSAVAEVLVVVRPRQVAYRTHEGVGVEVPEDALFELIAALPDGIVVLARVHTHPGTAYHSEVDDTNMLIAHDGAISIVVPDFARARIDLERCSVNELRHGEGWVELDAGAVRERLRVR
ncbi:MAG: hypothetical protein QOH12_3034 [Solirubrobacteraceae bacterium]|jgi:hypothetical protein|nr:hypothetical protein [Solirubrobacteraceae bacterium]